MTCDPKSIYMDVIGDRAGPGSGDVIQCIGKSGKLNTTYLVIHSYIVKRRIPTPKRRYQMRVVVIPETTKKERLKKGANYFELRWYPRAKRKRDIY